MHYFIITQFYLEKSPTATSPIFEQNHYTLLLLLLLLCYSISDTNPYV